MTVDAKSAIIRAGLEALALPGAGCFAPSAAGRGLVLTLHHVRPPGAHSLGPNGHLSVEPGFLAAALDQAKASGLVPVRLAELPHLLSDPEDRRRFIAVTLDDGYRDNVEYAAPIFRRAGMPYTIFLTPGFV